MVPGWGWGTFLLCGYEVKGSEFAKSLLIMYFLSRYEAATLFLSIWGKKAMVLCRKQRVQNVLFLVFVV